MQMGNLFVGRDPALSLRTAQVTTGRGSAAQGDSPTPDEVAGRRALLNDARRLARLIRSTVATALIALWCVALLLVARRWAGAMQPPADSSLLIFAGATLAAVGAAVRCAWFWPFKQLGYQWSDRAVCCLPTVTLIMIATALTFPESPLWMTLVMWLLVLGGEAVSLQLTPDFRTSGRRPVARRGETTARPAGDEQRGSHASSIEAPVVRRDASDDTGLAPEVVQSFTRSQLPDGSDVLHGKLRGQFHENQRSISLHLAFCPPLVAVPELNVEQLEGPVVSIKKVQVLPYGARLDLRRKNTGRAAETILLEVYAVARDDD